MSGHRDDLHDRILRSGSSTLLLGIMACIFEFVPLLGPATVAVVVVTTAALGDDPWKALYAAIFLGVLRVVQDYLLYPSFAAVSICIRW